MFSDDAAPPLFGSRLLSVTARAAPLEVLVFIAAAFFERDAVIGVAVLAVCHAAAVLAHERVARADPESLGLPVCGQVVAVLLRRQLRHEPRRLVSLDTEWHAGECSLSSE